MPSTEILCKTGHTREYALCHAPLVTHCTAGAARMVAAAVAVTPYQQAVRDLDGVRLCLTCSQELGPPNFAPLVISSGQWAGVVGGEGGGGGAAAVARSEGGGGGGAAAAPSEVQAARERGVGAGGGGFTLAGGHSDVVLSSVSCLFCCGACEDKYWIKVSAPWKRTACDLQYPSRRVQLWSDHTVLDWAL